MNALDVAAAGARVADGTSAGLALGALSWLVVTALRALRARGAPARATWSRYAPGGPG